MGGDRRSGEVAQTMYTHVSKCKNGKIKERKCGTYIMEYYLAIKKNEIMSFARK
jgi:hypothetical protein